MTAFFKASGAGNDFIALAEPEREPTPDEVRAWCRRGLSLGADGVFTLTRTARGGRMTYYNADGSRGELCLNGSRCAARLAFHLGWRESLLELETDAGPLAARLVDGERVTLELPPIAGTPRRLALAVGGATHEGWHVEVGVPHFVLPWPGDLAAAPVATLGPSLRAHPDLGPRGANASFVRFAAPGRLALRTFERGVEAETLACGTAVVAAVLAGEAAGALGLPAAAATAGGFELIVDRDGDALSLTGDARIVARGELLPGARTLSAPRS
jgi:diaminopimelate epimerase